MRILITDGESRSALAVTRSLGRKGCAVFVSSLYPRNISACSKFCKKSFLTPDPLQEVRNYSNTIFEIASKEHIDVIFPITEQSIYCLNLERDRFEKEFALACAPQEKMIAVSNKFKLFQLAEKLSIAMPETIYVESSDDFFDHKYKMPNFPVVVKPGFSKIEDGGRILSAGVKYASNEKELNHLYQSKPELRYPSLIQELIMGEGTGLFTLYDANRHLTLFSHRRLREKPPSGGVSVVSESIPLDEEMVEAADRLLSAVNWTGVAMVEFKRDVRDGKPKLMEINGRFWGSLQLSIACGIDFPGLYLDYLLGKKTTSTTIDYGVGHKLKWFWGTFDHLVILFKKNYVPFDNTLVKKSKLGAICEILNILEKNVSFDVFDKEDLSPFVLESKKYLIGCLKKSAFIASCNQKVSNNGKNIKGII